MIAHEDRELKLPAWAQRKLDELRRELLAVARHRDALLLENNPEGATAVLDPHLRPVGLGPDPRVRFLMSPDPHDYIDVRAVSTHSHDGLPTDHALEIHGATGLVIAPVVTNSLRIGLRR